MNITKNIYKVLLGDFLSDTVRKDLFNDVKNYTLNSNLIFEVNDIVEMKQILTSLVIQSSEKDKKSWSFYSTSLRNLVDSKFDKDGTESINMFLNKKYMAIYETDELEHKLHSDLIRDIISERIISNKNTWFFLIKRNPKDLISKDLLNYFIIVNMKKYITFKKNEEIY